MSRTSLSASGGSRQNTSQSGLRRLVVAGLAIGISLLAVVPVEAAPPVDHPMISDIRPFSFAVSWTSSRPAKGSVQVEIGRSWVSVSDVRGSIASTTHLFQVPCSTIVHGCAHHLTARSSYSVRVFESGKQITQVHVRTASNSAPFVPLAAVGGRVRTDNGNPVQGALVYVTVHHGSQTSVPLAALTIPNGGWLIALANAVTASGQPFPLAVGNRLTIRIATGRTSTTASATLRSVNRPLLVKPVTVH